MSELTKNDLNFIVSRLPKDVRVAMKKEKVFLGGGFIRATIAGEKPSDIDLFGETKELLSSVAYILASERKIKVHETQNALTLLSHPRLTVQFITRWLFSTIQDLIKSFDFTVCQAAIGYNRETNLWESATSEDFYSDLAARRLVYTCPDRNEDAGGSILRVRKYLERGYNIQAQSLSRVIARLVMGVKDVEAFRDEKWLGTVLTSLLREVDPLIVVDGIEIIDEHEITTTETKPNEGIIVPEL